MRILFLTNAFPSPWFPFRGTYNFELARSLADSHEVKVVAPIPWLDELRCSRNVAAGPPRSRVETRDGLTIHYPRYYYPPKVGRFWYHKFLWHSIHSTLRRRLNGFRPEVVISYWTHPDGTVAVKYARQVGAAAFLLVGGSDVLCDAENSANRRRVISATLRAADGVFVVSSDLRQRVIDLGVLPERVHLVYRGVDRQRFAPGDRASARMHLKWCTDQPHFLWVGRMVPVKGLDLLLRAVHRLQSRGFRFQLVLAGDGAERPRLEETAAALGLGERVRFVGNVAHADLADWYRAADWTVLTSHSEGVPNVLLESHACGTPFIATCVGGVAEIAVAGVDRLVAPSDAAGLADQIAGVLTSDAVDKQRLAAHVHGLESAALRIASVLQQTVEFRRIMPREPFARASAAAGR